MKSTKGTLSVGGKPTDADSLDVSTVDGLVKAMYASVSFPPGSQPNYNRLKTLFHPEARVVPPKNEKESSVPVIGVGTYMTRSKEFVVLSGLERRGFVETEVARRTLAFGGMVHIFSTYECRSLPSDAVPSQRGINSMQLIRDGGRWWILSLVWEVERPGTAIPKAYLT